MSFKKQSIFECIWGVGPRLPACELVTVKRSVSGIFYVIQTSFLLSATDEVPFLTETMQSSGNKWLEITPSQPVESLVAFHVKSNWHSHLSLNLPLSSPDKNQHLS